MASERSRDPWTRINRKASGKPRGRSGMKPHAATVQAHGLRACDTKHGDASKVSTRRALRLRAVCALFLVVWAPVVAASSPAARPPAAPVRAEPAVSSAPCLALARLKYGGGGDWYAGP